MLIFIDKLISSSLNDYCSKINVIFPLIISLSYIQFFNILSGNPGGALQSVKYEFRSIITHIFINILYDSRIWHQCTGGLMERLL